MSKKANFGWVNDDNMALLVDLYELTMAESYLRCKRNEVATFELFVRHLPERRSFLVSAGLEQILFFLERIRFTEESLYYLRKLGTFSEDILGYL